MAVGLRENNFPDQLPERCRYRFCLRTIENRLVSPEWRYVAQALPDDGEINGGIIEMMFGSRPTMQMMRDMRSHRQQGARVKTESFVADSPFGFTIDLEVKLPDVMLVFIDPPFGLGPILAAEDQFRNTGFRLVKVKASGNTFGRGEMHVCITLLNRRNYTYIRRRWKSENGPACKLAPMKLTPSQLKQYQEQGYVAVPHFFTEREIAAMQVELARLKSEGLLRNVCTENDGKTQTSAVQNLQICPLSPKSEFFRALPFCDKIINVVCQCLGDEVQQQLDQIFLKPGRHGAGTSWHQDNAYFGLTDPIEGVGMWVAMHDATVANGTMNVIPGIYREKLEHTRDAGSDHHVRCYPNEDKAVAVELKAGGALFFNYGVPHCTKTNTTDKERAGLALHFVRPGVPAKWGPLGPVLTGANASDGTKEWGVKVAGTWDQQVAKMLS